MQLYGPVHSWYTHTHAHNIYYILCRRAKQCQSSQRQGIHTRQHYAGSRQTGIGPPHPNSQDRMDGEARPRNIVHDMSFTLLAAPTTNLDILRLASILDLRLLCEN